MTTKQIQARLTQLEGLAKLKDAEVKNAKHPFEFPIDPEIAKALRDDRLRLLELRFARPKVDNTPEEAVIRARIAETASKVVCPPCYGFNEYWEDQGPAVDMWSEKYKKRQEKSLKMSKAENEQQVARMEVYLHSPEGRGRLRLNDLVSGIRWKSPAEHDEIKQLAELYPETWCHPEDRAYFGSIGTPEERQRRAEHDQRFAEKLTAMRRERAQNKK